MCHPASTSSSILNFTFPVLMRLLLVLIVIPSFVQQQVHAAAAAQLQSPLKRFSTLPSLLALLVSDVANSGQFFVQALPGYRNVGRGDCQDSFSRSYDFIGFEDDTNGAVINFSSDCRRLCAACACEGSNANRQFRGFTYYSVIFGSANRECWCHFDNVAAFTRNECQNISAGKGVLESPASYVSSRSGNGVISGSTGGSSINLNCYATQTTFDCPSDAPSESPSIAPSKSSSDAPSDSPSISFIPSESPSIPPSESPSIAPSKSSSDAPSDSPSISLIPSESPSIAPSESPSIPPSDSPSIAPSDSPSISFIPSESPSIAPSESPSIAPSDSPSIAPSDSPSISFIPSESPSIAPSESPSIAPSKSSSDAPSGSPSIVPSESPSIAPSESKWPSHTPSIRPSTSASPSSSSSPTAKASKAPKASKTPKAASTSSLQVQEMKSEGGTPYSSSFSPLTMLGVCGTFAVISVTFVDLFY